MNREKFEKIVYKVVHCTEEKGVYTSIWAGQYTSKADMTAYHNNPITYKLHQISVASERCVNKDIWCFESLRGAKYVYKNNLFDRKPGNWAILRCRAIGKVTTSYNTADECNALKIEPLQVVYKF
jgi:hypothetical protein